VGGGGGGGGRARPARSLAGNPRIDWIHWDGKVVQTVTCDSVKVGVAGCRTSAPRMGGWQGSIGVLIGESQQGLKPKNTATGWCFGAHTRPNPLHLLPQEGHCVENQSLLLFQTYHRDEAKGEALCGASPATASSATVSGACSAGGVHTSGAVAAAFVAMAPSLPFAAVSAAGLSSGSASPGAASAVSGACSAGGVHTSGFVAATPVAMATSSPFAVISATGLSSGTTGAGSASPSGAAGVSGTSDAGSAVSGSIWPPSVPSATVQTERGGVTFTYSTSTACRHGANNTWARQDRRNFDLEFGG